MADTKNKQTNFSNLDKVVKQAEIIDKNGNNILVDIDILLDYVRQLYIECYTYKENYIKQINTVRKESSGTLSLFGDNDIYAPEVKNKPITKIEEKDKSPKVENIPTPPQPTQTIEPIETKIIEQPIIETIEEELSENQTNEGQIIETSTVVEPVENQEIAPIEENLDNQEEENISKLDENQEIEENIEKPNTDIELDFTEIENKNNKIKEIDLDDIIFEEGLDDNETEEYTTPAHQRKMPPSYWGDETDIENPIPVKVVSIGETYKQERPSINDMVAKTNDNNIASKFTPNHSSDLMNAIDMNNKFLFIKELFRNNGSIFTEEINKLNNCKKITEVIATLDTMKQKYNWNENSEAFNRLYELVIKKFA